MIVDVRTASGEGNLRGEAVAGEREEDSTCRCKNGLRRREHQRRSSSYGKEKMIVDVRTASGEGNLRGEAVVTGKRRG
jgi:hypothetical protein